MEVISLGFAISAFIAGLLTFLAPCTLPLVPAYLGFISGVSNKDLKDPTRAKEAKRKIILNGLFFILGFFIVFVLFGTLAGVVGQGLTPYRILLTQIGGALVILFGLFMLGVFKIPFLQVQHQMKMPSFLTIGKPSTSVTIGGAFAFGWTPCVGPILGSILLLASTEGSALTGAALLAIFSFGLAVPFVLISLAFGHASEYINDFFSFISRWRVVILAVLGLLAGLLLNVVMVALQNVPGVGQSISELGLLLLEEAVWVMPVVTAVVLGALGYVWKSIDTLSFIGGVFLILLGILLFTNAFSLLIQFGFQLFEVIGYEGLLDHL